MSYLRVELDLQILKSHDFDLWCKGDTKLIKYTGLLSGHKPQFQATAGPKIVSSRTV